MTPIRHRKTCDRLEFRCTYLSGDRRTGARPLRYPYHENHGTDGGASLNHCSVVQASSNKHEETAGRIDPRLSATDQSGLNMKAILLAAAALVAIGGAAQAADMPLKAPPAPATCTMCDWSGFYIGGNAGAGIGMNRTIDAANFSAPGTLAAISPGILNPVTADSLTRAPVGFV